MFQHFKLGDLNTNSWYEHLYTVLKWQYLPLSLAILVYRGIANITISSTEALSAVVVGGLGQVNDSETKMIQIKLKEHLGGHRRICFEAADL